MTSKASFMKSSLRITNIECYAYHGCLPEETKIGGNFRVDVLFECDFTKAISTDDLRETIDYVLVHKIVREQMAIPSRLIEHVCGRIANALIGLVPGKGMVEVAVTKFNPPVNGQVGETAFTLQLSKNQ